GRPGLHDNGGPLVPGQGPRLARPVIAGLARGENLAGDSRPPGVQGAAGPGGRGVHWFPPSFFPSVNPVAFSHEPARRGPSPVVMRVETKSRVIFRAVRSGWCRGPWSPWPGCVLTG